MPTNSNAQRFIMTLLILNAILLLTTTSASKFPNLSSPPSPKIRGSDNSKLHRKLISNTAGTTSNSNDLSSTGCHKPSASGGWGFCGPTSCKNNYITCKAYDSFGVFEGGGPTTVDGVSGGWNKDANDGSTCGTFLERSSIPDLTVWNPNGSCKSSCTQNTNKYCTSEFLSGVLTGDGIKYAYCNDNWLIVGASGLPSVFTSNLNDVPYPPGKSGSTQRTGEDTVDANRIQEMFYPLDVTDLSTAAGTNNIGVFDSQSGAGPQSYLVKDGTEKYGLPSDGGIGMAINGQPIFPVYNNVVRCRLSFIL